MYMCTYMYIIVACEYCLFVYLRGLFEVSLFKNQVKSIVCIKSAIEGKWDASY